jgi:hypothetical protein
MTSFKAATSRIELKGTRVSRSYLLIDQATVMDCSFDRVGRRGTASRRRVGRPAGTCD